MSQPNLGWLYWVDYFKGIDYRNLESEANKQSVHDKTQNLIEASTSENRQNDEMLGNIHFTAATVYPGLLIGTGYRHELPDIVGQPILGFHFDYTTGLPVIPGSSVKGVLRSAFTHRDFIMAVLREVTGRSWSDEEIEKAEIAIFGNPVKSHETVGGSDIFFDAVVVSAVEKILADDYIAPHGDGVTDEPTPLRFVKVGPGVTFRFDFDLADTTVGDKNLTPVIKRKLFMTLLELLGIGSKTSVGYGHLENFHIVQSDEERAAQRENEIRQRYEEAGNDTEKLQRFLADYPTHPLSEEVKNRLHALREEAAVRHIETAFDRLDKNNSKHIESFIAKYENDPKAQTWIDKARELLASKNRADTEIDFLRQIVDLKKLKNIESLVKKTITVRALSEEEKAALEKAVTDVEDRPKKRRKFPFSVFGHAKALGKERANVLANRLGL